MYHKKCSLSIAVLLVPSLTAQASEHLLASYEESELGCLTVTSPDGYPTWPVLGGEGGVPEATDGDYVLELCWSDETDRKIQIGHHWSCSSFSLAGFSEVVADVYVPTPSDRPDTVGLWDTTCWNPPLYPSWITGCEPTAIAEWDTISMYVADLLEESTGQSVSCIEALVFEDLGADDGCIYIDNLRLTRDEISFSGYNWWIKNACDVGPGWPLLNSFSKDNVWVDPEGYLHLNIAFRDPEWYCSEIVGNDSFGYGTYVFTVQTPIPSLDENAILGLFTYDPNAPPDQNQREMDFEFGRWKDPLAANAQYVVVPEKAVLACMG